MFAWRDAARVVVACVVAMCGTGCVGGVGQAEDPAGVDSLTFGPSSSDARRQYQANLEFARDYQPRCPSGPSTELRVLVSGFGGSNASGAMVGQLVPEARHRPGDAPVPGRYAPPDKQLTVGWRMVSLPGGRTVEMCAMVLPVQWDLAAVLVAREVDAFGPSLVVMNGVAGPRQPLWIELGATNVAFPSEDSVGLLTPEPPAGQVYAPLIESAPADQYARGNLLSWQAVKGAGLRALAKMGSRRLNGDAFDDIVRGVALAPFPRGGNTYICNNVVYTVGYLMDHAHEAVRLLRAPTLGPQASDGVDVVVSKDYSQVPRVFVHWPYELDGPHLSNGAELLGVLLAAQVDALVGGDPPSRGDNANADPITGGGATY